MAVLRNEIDVSNADVLENGHKTGRSYKTTVEEIDDEADLEAHMKLKSEKHLLYHIDEELQREGPARAKHPTYTSEHNQPIPTEGEAEETSRHTFTAERESRTSPETT